MDQQPVAEVLPGLYRAVLDAVADLEARNRRADAALIRTEATAIYSRAWTPDAARRLRALRARADRVREGRRPTRYESVLASMARKAELERELV